MSAVAPPAPVSARVLLASVVLLTALAYLPVLRYAFVYDDQGIIVENPKIRAWSYLPQYFKGQLWEHLFPNTPANYYRPLNLVFFRLNHALFGLHPMGWHAYALLLHLLATALVFAIVRKITQRPYVAAVAALLFGVHPSHHEVVAWISSTTESLFTVLFLAAFLAYLKSREGGAIGWMAASCAFYAGGLLSKETAIVLPAVVFAHAWIYGTRACDEQVSPSWLPRFWRAAGRASAYIPVCILYIAVRMQVLHGFSHPQTAVNYASWLFTLPSVLLFYLRQWLVPLQYSEFYDLPLRTSWDALHVLIPIVLLAAAGAALWFFRRRLGTREVALALVVIAVPLLPALNLSVFPEGELVHDRYSYLPSLGAALIAGLALQPLIRGRLVFGLPQRLVLAMLAILVPLSYSTGNAASYWSDDSTLFEHAHRMAPDNAMALNNYAVQRALAGDPGAAMNLLEQLLNKHPNSFLANYNLGRLLYQFNLLPAAEHYMLLAQKLDPTRPDTNLELGLICTRAGRAADAESYFRKAISMRPDDPKYRFALGVVQAQRGNCEQARTEFAQALVLDPGLTKAREQSEKCGTEAAAGTKSSAPLPRVRVPLEPVKGQ